MTENRCPSCDGPLPAHALDGHCPRCLLLLCLESEAPSLNRGLNGETIDLPDRPDSVLETIGATIGAVPRVMLRDTAFGEEPSPIIRPTNGNETSTRFRIDGEIARGGMGAILKGRDPDLGRDVAIKVLREDLRGNDDLVRRFVEEAQISGQLQHPGIVPIYELGTFADRRPFFSMKLVKGRTLADLLAARPTPADDLPRFLSIFAAMAQTMAYAHTRGVIHRDLKPSNVMVGSFGEVQVMDWGLAKVLPRGGVVDDASAGKLPPGESVIATARSGSEDAEHSHAGSVLGTPSYMAPEQARGEIDRVDERADVFALGSILCEILTGRPAFVGRTSGEIQRKAALGDLGDALARLVASGADADLVTMARDCQAREPEDRPRSAGVVTARLTAYLAGVQEKLSAAERERAVAEAKVVEERKQRRLQTGLAAAVLALTTMGGLGAVHDQRQRSARAATVAKVIGEASTLRDVARSHPEDVARWQMALAAVRQAEGVAGGEAEALRQLAALRDEVRAGAEAAERDRALLDRLIDIRSAKDYDRDGSETDSDYAEAFREAALDLSALPPDEAGAKIKARPPTVALALATALDDWASVRRVHHRDPAGARRLAEAARVADPDPWRNDLRAALDLDNKDRRKEALKRLAGTASFDELGTVSLDQLGNALADAWDLATAETVLRRTQRRHSGDIWVNYDLARVLEKLNQRDDAIRFYTAARAVRPELAHELAHALAAKGESDEAIEVFQELTRLRPKNGRHQGCLGTALQERGRPKEAAAALERAVAAHREAIRLKPDHADAHSHLGYALHAQGKPDEAVAEFRDAIRLKPNFAQAHVNLGTALQAQGKPDEAVAEFRDAIRLKPDLAEAHVNLGNALKARGRLDEAVTEYREVIRLKPDFAEAHCNLGLVLGNQGDYAGALKMLRRGHEMGSKRPGWPYPSAQWVARAERQGALAERLPALLKGEDHPKDVAERLALAPMCNDKKCYAAAARFWAEALEADHKLGDDRQAGHRYNAACSAALASAGQGEDDPPPDDASKAKLRGQALEWLKAEQAAWSKLLESGPSQGRPAIARTLNHWKQDSDLAGIRDVEALAKLPEADRKDCQAFWAEVEALLKRAQGEAP